jgi:iron-sulfur cluster repair protein YtfE (RIC family)
LTEFTNLLRLLKRDLLVHSCLEDYVLFPRARDMEAQSWEGR